MNFGENWLSIDPKANYATTLKAVNAVLTKYPGVFRDSLTYLNERIEEVLSGSKERLVIRVFGPDLKVIRAKAKEIQHTVARIEPGSKRFTRSGKAEIVTAGSPDGLAVLVRVPACGRGCRPPREAAAGRSRDAP